MDLCNCDGNLQFCHGGEEVGCGVGRRDPIEIFQQINDWITDNPNNVIMIWLEVNEEAGGSITLDDIKTLVDSVPIGNSDKSFSQRLFLRDRYDESDWPKLSEMIQDEQQILFFYQGGPNGSIDPPDGIHYYYDYGVSTHWEYTSVSELKDTISNDCPVGRGSSYRKDFFMMNNFVTAKVWGVPVRPSQSAAEEINTGTFLEPLFDICEISNGMKVNIVSVDFWNSGTLSDFVNTWNEQLVSPTNNNNAYAAVPSTTTTAPAPTPTPAPAPKPTTNWFQNGLSGFKDVNFGG